MNATIRADGTLVVSPENELEAYALGRWSSTNFNDWQSVTAKHLKIVVDCSAWPAAIEPLLMPGEVRR